MPKEDMVVRPGDKEEIQAQFAGWETELLQLLEVSQQVGVRAPEPAVIFSPGFQCLETTTRWPINMLVPLPTSSCGRVAIMGDAASLPGDLRAPVKTEC